MPQSGFLNIDKPAGWSSRKVVDQIQRIIRPTKVGHAGTLDPLATGVLVIAIGGATRLIRFLHSLPKCYEATFQWGCQSESDDTETNVTPVPIHPTVTREAVARCIDRLPGTVRQVPPRYSAVKVKGQRAYRLARRGLAVDIAEREVVIHQAHLMDWDPPFLKMQLTCSAGTYVRAVGRDLAGQLGTAAVMTALVRTAVGPFRLSDTTAPDEITAETLPSLLAPPLTAIAHVPQRRLEEIEVIQLRQGRPLSPGPEEESVRADAPDCVAAIDKAGCLVAMLARRPDHRYWPVCVLPAVPGDSS